MAKKPLLSDQDRTNIAMAFKSNPSAKAESIRQRASELCDRELGLSTVQRELVPLRKSFKEGKTTSPKDKPWSLASLTDYPIQPHVIIPLLRMAESIQKIEGHHLTIRSAIWINRLFPLAEAEVLKIDLDSNEKEGLIVKIWSRLTVAATMYGIYESSCELIGIPCDTGVLDAPTLVEIEKNIDSYFSKLKIHDELTLQLGKRKRMVNNEKQ